MNDSYQLLNIHIYDEDEHDFGCKVSLLGVQNWLDFCPKVARFRDIFLK
jgi:hypothetical protein